ncbi:MAG: hypothetical protein RL095_1125 [Verrucomicrobiota bacterium]|jgi:uncharacterized protein (TIGR01777 family)
MTEEEIKSAPVLLVGGRGYLGRALTLRLVNAGIPVIRLIRGAEATYSERSWDPEKEILDVGVFNNIRAVIHLGGAGVADRPWTAARRQELRDSRIKTTELLVGRMMTMERPPPVFICASGVNAWAGGETLWSEKMLGPESWAQDFLGDLCRDWEAAAAPLAERGDVRVVHLRFGVVLGRRGGFLERMEKIFAFGAGGRLGKGTQHLPWISEEDATAAILHILEKPELAGPVNLVAPQLINNRDFTAILADAIGMPAFFHVPAFLLKLLPGDMGPVMMLKDLKIEPATLRASGFAWRHPELRPYLESLFTVELPADEDAN